MYTHIYSSGFGEWVFSGVNERGLDLGVEVEHTRPLELSRVPLSVSHGGCPRPWGRLAGVGARQGAVGSLLALEERGGKDRASGRGEAEAPPSGPSGGHVLSARPLGTTAWLSLSGCTGCYLPAAAAGPNAGAWQGLDFCEPLGSPALARLTAVLRVKCCSWSRLPRTAGAVTATRSEIGPLGCPEVTQQVSGSPHPCPATGGQRPLAVSPAKP